MYYIDCSYELIFNEVMLLQFYIYITPHKNYKTLASRTKNHRRFQLLVLGLNAFKQIQIKIDSQWWGEELACAFLDHATSKVCAFTTCTPCIIGP